MVTKSPRRAALDAVFRSEADLRSGLTENLSEARAESERVEQRVRRAFRDFDAPDPGRVSTGSSQPRRAGRRSFEATGRLMRERLDSLDTSPRGRAWPSVRTAPSSSGRGATTSLVGPGGAVSSSVSSWKPGGARRLALSVPTAVTACEAERQAKAWSPRSRPANAGPDSRRRDRRHGESARRAPSRERRRRT